MGRISRLLLGAAVFGAAAAGVYGYLKNSEKKAEGVTGEGTADAKTAPDAGEPAEENRTAFGESADTADEGPGCAEEKKEETPDSEKASAESAAQSMAADAAALAARAYTTLKAGADAAAEKVKKDVMPKVRENIGPKGEDILHVMGETAVRFRDTMVDSAGQVRDILSKGEKTYSTVDTTCREKQEEAEKPAGENGAAEAFEQKAEEAASAAAAVADDAMETVQDAVNRAAEEVNRTEQFFDDSRETGE
ncbi:hypothetical protein [Lachnoclostridium sp. Marseille-P6806]|uniref:hypothetical protein n=1 Tax=Lachnoclostridium sp. Marseille-P6806 TaxID=2364793 RepID=UPI001031C40C|nr:hypothetical protein [Lachnoclostridium sp. Marseille-P6806]